MVQETMDFGATDLTSPDTGSISDHTDTTPKEGIMATKTKVKAKNERKAKPAKVVRVCSEKGCKNKPRTDRASRCWECQKKIRKAQLAANNVTWRKRVEKGTAGHHLVYRGKPTAVAKALKKLGREPEKLIVQGEPLPKTIREKVVKVDVTPTVQAAKKDPAKVKAAPKAKREKAPKAKKAPPAKVKQGPKEKPAKKEKAKREPKPKAKKEDRPKADPASQVEPEQDAFTSVAEPEREPAPAGSDTELPPAPVIAGQVSDPAEAFA